MQPSKACGSLMVLVLMVVLTNAPAVLAAAGIGLDIGGAGSCNEVKSQIKRDWFDLKPFFRSGEKSMQRPKSRDFFCVSPAYTRDAIEKHSATSLRCYSMRGQQFCCDQQLQACAGL